MAEIISAVYKITNTITGDFYIGSSKDVKRRWKEHKKPSVWKKYPNNPLYLDMKRYGVDSFELQILAEVEEGKLKPTEQQFIETLKPTYNNRNANGLDIERKKEYQKEHNKEYQKTNKYKEYQREYHQQNRKKQIEYQREYYQQNREKKIEYQREYYQQNREKKIEYQIEYYQQNHDKRKEYQIEYYQQNHDKRKEYQIEYNNQLCSYNGETLTLSALRQRFKRAGIAYPTKEAKKYLVL